MALTLGALHALPADTSGPPCSENSNSFRAYLLEGFDLKDSEEEDARETRAFNYYSGIAYLDEVGVLCQEAVLETLDKTYWQDFAQNVISYVPVNLAYNAGFMWVDVINFIYYTPETVPQQDWGFFAAYIAGDFIIRFFYHDNTPQ